MHKENSDTTRSLPTIEPTTTVVDEGKFLRILTELPDIHEEKIKIDLEHSSTSVTIIAANTIKQYKKVIAIPCAVRFHKKRFSNGVLEITLEKTKNELITNRDNTCL